VHAETSTGVRNDVEAVGRNKGEALLLVDMVTSLGGIPVEVDAWGVDIAYSGTQKCLGVPPGLAPLTVSARALTRAVARPSSWYLDLSMLARYVNDGSGGRVYHHTAPVAMVAALHAGLGVLLDEGLEEAWQRHAACGARLAQGLHDLGLELLVDDAPHRLPQLTTVRVPEGVDESAVRRTLLGEYGIEIGAGAGQLAGQVWRIGCMGNTARPRNVLTLLGALEAVLEPVHGTRRR